MKKMANKNKSSRCGCSCGESTELFREPGGGSSTGHGHAPGDDHDHDHGLGWLPVAAGFLLLTAGILMDYVFHPAFFTEKIRFFFYCFAYIPVGIPVIREAVRGIMKKDFFTEFTLMAIATLGAFLIGEYPEGVAVMLFYSVGEMFQDSAVRKARGNIKALLDIRPGTAHVLKNGVTEERAPEEVRIGECVRVKAGERIPLDGRLISPSGSFNTSALTGESAPRFFQRGETVLAGMVNMDKVADIEVEKEYCDSSLARILDLVQNASSRKARPELAIRRFARIYTPAVFAVTFLIAVLPFFFLSDYVFETWFYRALIFLVISCPCALVISIPLTFFAGIGAASRNGILFKGANYLDTITRVDTVVTDKTGTLTKGTFRVREVWAADGDPGALLRTAASLEKMSTHPIARAVVEACGAATADATDAEELAGMGLRGTLDGATVLTGNGKLMERYGIRCECPMDTEGLSVVHVAIDGAYRGCITVSDEPKEEAARAVEAMKQKGIRRIVMLSGDRESVVARTAGELGIEEYYGELMPDDKLKFIENLKTRPDTTVAFVGDGINDTPALALSDVGIAMGGLGSDAAIEVADVVIQTDDPSRIVRAIDIGRTTRRIVVQNIVLAVSLKLLVMVLGLFGLATMWEAVFADVGVSLLTILNAIRILKKYRS